MKCQSSLLGVAGPGLRHSFERRSQSPPAPPFPVLATRSPRGDSREPIGPQSLRAAEGDPAPRHPPPRANVTSTDRFHCCAQRPSPQALPAAARRRSRQAGEACPRRGRANAASVPRRGQPKPARRFQPQRNVSRSRPAEERVSSYGGWRSGRPCHPQQTGPLRMVRGRCSLHLFG